MTEPSYEQDPPPIKSEPMTTDERESINAFFWSHFTPDPELDEIWASFVQP